MEFLSLAICYAHRQSVVELDRVELYNVVHVVHEQNCYVLRRVQTTYDRFGWKTA